MLCGRPARTCRAAGTVSRGANAGRMTRGAWTLLALVALALPAFAQGDLERLRDAAVRSPYAYRVTEHLCNRIGPRLTGSPQAEAAVAYVADEMRRAGLEVTLQPVKVKRWVRGAEEAALVRYSGQVPGTTQKIAVTALGNTVATPAKGLTAPLVVVDSIEALERVDVRGRIVLFDVTFDERMEQQGWGGPAYGQVSRVRYLGPAAAAGKGAAAALVRSAGSGAYRMPHTGVTKDTTIPAGAVASEDAELLARLAREGPVSMRLLLTPRTLPDGVSHNVIADLRGRELPERYVVVSGHLDSWDLGTGALDDASGVAVAMAAVKEARDLGLRPRRTLRMVAFMNEENGGAGGDAYAAEYPPALHEAALESDLGAGHPVGVWFRGPDDQMTALWPLAAVLEPIGAGLIQRTLGAGSDIAPLGKGGVPCLSPLQDSRTYFTYHHTAADTLDKVDPVHLAENAAVMAVWGYGLAER